MHVSLERSGQFHARNMVPTPCKCASMRTKNYSYFVRINANDSHLSREGFVLNNEEIQTYFDRRFGKLAASWQGISCELMALASARELCQMLLREGIALYSVVVRIKGSNGAWIEAICNKEDVKQ
jgi:hypothetical protein